MNVKGSLSAGASELQRSLQVHPTGFSISRDPNTAKRQPLRALPSGATFKTHLAQFSSLSEPDLPTHLVRLVRTLQRHVCLVIEHWEYANAVLAVQYGQLMKSKNNFSESEFKELFLQMNQRMAALRDHEAEWCLEAFVEIREILENPTLLIWAASDSDFASEKKATRALILGALQKICLPSSVSRHKYCQKVFKVFAQLIDLELAVEPQCVALQTCSLGFKLTVFPSVSTDVEAALKMIALPSKQNQCVLFECSHVLKIMAWKLPYGHYSALVFDFVMCKWEPNLPARHWWELVVDTLAMPSSFSVLGDDPWFQPEAFELSEPENALRTALIHRMRLRVKSSEASLPEDLLSVLLDKLSE
jgi:hypothetical protein